MNTIVVVEDEAVIAHDIQDALQQLGYRTPKPSATGLEALRSVEETRPDLVLMDIRLRGAMDGITAAQQVRERFSIPVVYLTAHSDETTLRRAKETCPHGYIVKPFYKHDLRATIEIALHRAAVERKLADRERWFATTLDSIGDAVIATDPGEAITFMNPLAEKLTGWDRQDAHGKPIRDVLQLDTPEGTTRDSPVGEAIRDRTRVEAATYSRLRNREGAQIPVDDAATAIVDAHGQVLGGVVVFRDISERLRLEQRVALAERLASLGTLTAGIAHEINNPLAAVIGNVAYAAAHITRVVSAEQHSAVAAAIHESLTALDDASVAADRVRRIVADLQAFSRTGSTERGPVALVDAIEAAIKLTIHRIRHCARLERQYEAHAYVYADEGRLVQVFTNLLSNAADAVGDGPVTENRIRVVTRVGTDGRAIAEVHDSGSGISKDVARHIFDPFFSTKGVGLGMGLGLSICHGIIHDAGGEISMESTPGVGTTFRIVLPIVAAPPGADSPHTEHAATPAGRGRILVVDDDASVCRMMERALQPWHDVCVETDAVLALRRILEGQTFDVILCDVMMPEMSGVDFYDRLWRVRPELALRIVFLTGGSFSKRATQFLQHGLVRTLEKPFTVDALHALVDAQVKRVLAGSN